MAIDDRDKRQSAHRAAGGLGLPNPDGTVDQNDRQHLLGFYGGILADEPVAVVAVESGPLDAPMRAVASSLLNTTFGDPITVTLVTAGTYTTATGVATPSTSTESPPAMVERYALRELTGLVQAGDLKVSIPALGYTKPGVDDTVTIGGLTYQVVNVRTVYANALPVLYTMQVRR